MRILFALPGFHVVPRGAEIALMSVAAELARAGDQVTLAGSGPPIAGTLYDYLQIGAVSRLRLERLPTFPPFRSDTTYEEAIFAIGLLARYRPAAFDITVTCSFPFINWVLRRPALGRRRPPHVFVTQNGDWPAYSNRSEFGMFGCDGLVCTNPDYLERNRGRWRTTLIPNGLSPERYAEAKGDRALFGLPVDRPVILMVSALIDSKRVDDAIRAVALMNDVYLVCAGDGPIRERIDELAALYLPGRFRRLTVDAVTMPALYRSADAFLHLSLNESFGNVYVEAMASGLPIVAHDLPRTRWIVGDDEYLCDTGDPRRLADTLIAAIAAPLRAPTAVARKIERFAWPLVARRYRNFFDEVLARSTPSPDPAHSLPGFET